VTSMAGFGQGTTAQNLDGAIEGETFEIEEMYPVYKEAAQSQGEKAAIVSFHYALAAERTHQRLFTEAKKAVEQGKDAALGAVSVCGKCGHTVEGPIPDKCPICGVSRDHYSTVSS
jgi:rubrerythrin